MSNWCVYNHWRLPEDYTSVEKECCWPVLSTMITMNIVKIRLPILHWVIIILQIALFDHIMCLFLKIRTMNLFTFSFWPFTQRSQTLSLDTSGQHKLLLTFTNNSDFHPDKPRLPWASHGDYRQFSLKCFQPAKICIHQFIKKPNKKSPYSPMILGGKTEGKSEIVRAVQIPHGCIQFI